MNTIPTKAETKSKIVPIRMTPTDHTTFAQLAETQRLSISNMVLELAKLQAVIALESLSDKQFTKACLSSKGV